MEFISYLMAHAVKCGSKTEMTVQTRLLFNLFNGLMSVDDMKARPLAAQAMTNAERLDYDDLFERKRIKLYAKSKVRNIFPNMSLNEFLNLPRQYMEFIVKTANEEYNDEAQSENAQANRLLKDLGLDAAKGSKGDKP